MMIDYRVSRGEVQEDQLTAAIEKSTAKVPSSAYLALALGTMAVSAGLQALNKKHASIFVGQWAAPFLLLGIYNKLVKQHGSDGAIEKGHRESHERGYVGNQEGRYIGSQESGHMGIPRSGYKTSVRSTPEPE
jgi:hypothetical protein